jgi:hypothetical protein
MSYEILSTGSYESVYLNLHLTHDGSLSPSFSGQGVTKDTGLLVPILVSKCNNIQV